MKPAWYKKTEPTTEVVEQLDYRVQLVKYTETSPVSGRKACKFAVVDRWGDATPWFPSAAAARLSWAMRPAPVDLSQTSLEACISALHAHSLSGTGITKIMIGQP